MAHEARSERPKLIRGERAASLSAARPASRSLAGVFFAIPPVALLGAALVLGFRGGGIVTEQWAPVAVGTAVALGALAAVGTMPSIPPPAWPALGALAGFLAWSAVSLAWSPDSEGTLETIARLALLALAAVVGASFGARRGVAQGVAAALAVGGSLLVVVIEVKILTGSTAMFAGTRLIWPIDYANGNAALVWLGLPALIAGAAASRVRPAARALVAAVAALVLAVGMMAQSRGGSIALVVTLVVCVVIATDRARFALTLAAVVLPVVGLFGRLTAGQPGTVSSDAVTRGETAIVAAAVAGVLVLLLAAVEHAWPARSERLGRGVAISVWAAVLVVGATAFVVHSGRPDEWLAARWHEFRNPRVAAADPARFGSARSNRYDYWRVAARSFEAHPFDGVAAGAFGVPWYRHRTLRDSVTDAHSWEAGALAETGVLGFLLLGAGLLLPFVRLVRARSELGGFASVALGGCAAYFVLHSSTDWLFLIPAVAIPAFVALGACAAAGGLSELWLAQGWQRAAVAVASLLALLVALPVYLSTSLTARAETQAATSTSRALNTLSLAERTNPWALEPKIARANILLQAGRPADAIRVARQATRSAPQIWLTWATLAEAERAAGHRAAAARALARTRALSPLGSRFG
jgi:O-Antigen ligase